MFLKLKLHLRLLCKERGTTFLVMCDMCDDMSKGGVVCCRYIRRRRKTHATRHEGTERFPDLPRGGVHPRVDLQSETNFVATVRTSAG
jgi:hypothetical protein